MLLKKHKNKILAAAVIVLILAASFWLGGDAPGSGGLDFLQEDTSDMQEPHSISDTEGQSEGDSTDAIDGSKTEQTGNVAEEAPDFENPTEVIVADIQTDAETEKQENSDASADKENTQSDGGEISEQVTAQDANTDKGVLPENTDIPEVTETTCTISVNCGTILNNIDRLDSDKHDLVPADGWVLAPVTVTFTEGESVFNVLQRTMKQNGIHLEFMNTPMYNASYIEGINNIYEFDVGELSGWIYKVNGAFPSYGSSKYLLEQNDIIEWVYTCDLGADVGGENVLGTQNE